MIGLLVGLSVAGTHDEALLAALTSGHRLDLAQCEAVGAILAASPQIGFGDPAISVHPMSADACRTRRAEAGVTDPNPAFEAVCGRPWMAPLYDPATQTVDQATACVDQFEFPGVPCELPVIWVRASEAAALCEAIGKRLCDAHEWEGACSGALEAPDYRWDLAVGQPAEVAVKAMRAAHNTSHAKDWAYGEAFQRGVCAQASFKNETCDGSDPKRCGSNTYPTGAFPGCVSPLGVYDQHGNAAEHMNLPLSAEQRSIAGGPLGVTEMKGSWFIWDTYAAHEDWCRWRAPYWHGGPVRAADSHKNYHLSFRCCADVPPAR